MYVGKDRELVLLVLLVNFWSADKMVVFHGPHESYLSHSRTVIDLLSIEKKTLHSRPYPCTYRSPN